MGAARLARQMAMPTSAAERLIAGHRAAFPTFWSWPEAVETRALLHGEQTTVFGWRLAINADTNPRGLRNFPMQANGAEMLRLACCLVTEAGIKVCAPNHDALLIEAPLAGLEDAVASARHLMEEASTVVLDGFALRTLGSRGVRAGSMDRSAWTSRVGCCRARARRAWATCSPARHGLRTSEPPVHLLLCL